MIEIPNHLDALQKKALEAVGNCFDFAKERMGLYMPYPKVLFNLTGTVAGTACHARNTIRLNNRFLYDNTEDFLRQTISHECCHVFAREKFKGDISPHGKEWQRCMAYFDLPPNRCHNYLSEAVGAKPIEIITDQGVVTYRNGLQSLEREL